MPFAKAMDYNSDNDGLVTVLDVYNIAGYNYAPANYDITHTLSLSGMYELPLGKSKWYGGWQLSGIYYYRTGLAVDIRQNTGMLSTGTGNRPDTVGDPVLSDPTVDKWFDPAAFQQTTDKTGTWGNTGRDTVRGPGSSNIDMSIIKYTHIGRTNLELRAEAFNLLNHPQFSNPNGTIANAAVATITTMLSNPSCALCGTTERNIQFAAKLSF